MKDVRWSDFLLAIIIAPLLVLPVVLLVRAVATGLLDIDDAASSYLFSAAIIATCIVEGVVFAFLCAREGEAIEHVWAWFVAAAVIAAALLTAHLTGLMDGDVASWILLSCYSSLSWVFLVVVLSVYINGRRWGSQPSMARVADRSWDEKMAFLRR